MSPRLRLILTFVAKFSVSAGLIYWLLHDEDLSEIGQHFLSANITLLAGAFTLFFVGYFITAWRWHILLRSQGVEAPIRFLVQSFMVAIFFNNFLPSTIGGDVVRVYDSWRVGSSKSQAVSVIFVDRLLGLFALLTYALIAVQFSDTLVETVPYLDWWIALAVLCALVLLWLIFGTRRGVLNQLEARASGALQLPFRVFKKIATAFSAFEGRRDLLLRAFGLSLLLHLNVVLHFVLISMAMGIDVPAYAMFVIIPLATIIMMLPISVNAIGVREVVFAFFFAAYGISQAHSVAFAWMAYGFVLAQGLLGGLVFMFRKARPGPSDSG